MVYGSVGDTHFSYTIDVRLEVEVEVGRGNRIRSPSRRGRSAKEKGEEERFHKAILLLVIIRQTRSTLKTRYGVPLESFFGLVRV